MRLHIDPLSETPLRREVLLLRRFITISYEPCSKKDPHRTTLKHLRRRADGGNSRDNLIVACKACSDRRGRWFTCAVWKRNEFL